MVCKKMYEVQVGSLYIFCAVIGHVLDLGFALCNLYLHGLEGLGF